MDYLEDYYEFLFQRRIRRKRGLINNLFLTAKIA